MVSSLGFIHDLRAGLLEPDIVRGTPLDMDQYSRLFGTSRIPTDVRIWTPLFTDLSNFNFFSVVAEWKFTQSQDILLFLDEANSVCSFHLALEFIWLPYTNVFNTLDWFDVLDDDNLPVLTEREVLRNLQAIVTDADKTDKSEVKKYFPPSTSSF